MKHYIEVTKPGEMEGLPQRVLLNVTKIISVTEQDNGCRIYLQYGSFYVMDSYSSVCARLSAAERGQA